MPPVSPAIPLGSWTSTDGHVQARYIWILAKEEPLLETRRTQIEQEIQAPVLATVIGTERGGRLVEWIVARPGASLQAKPVPGGVTQVSLIYAGRQYGGEIRAHRDRFLATRRSTAAPTAPALPSRDTQAAVALSLLALTWALFSETEKLPEKKADPPKRPPARYGPPLKI